MNLPDHVAVMPLPNAILFPRVLLPLYIFEPRYRKMLADCLQGDRMFAVALRRAGGQPCGVAGVGVVRTSITRPDGTSNVILEGVARIQIEEYAQLKPYRLARVTPCVSYESTHPARAELVRAVRRLAKARAQLGAELPQSVLDSVQVIEDTGYLTDLVTYTLLDDYQQKQHLLETLDVHQRLDQLVEWLQQQVRQFDLWRALQGNLPNDHVGQN